MYWLRCLIECIRKYMLYRMWNFDLKLCLQILKRELFLCRGIMNFTITTRRQTHHKGSSVNNYEAANNSYNRMKKIWTTFGKLSLKSNDAHLTKLAYIFNFLQLPVFHHLFLINFCSVLAKKNNLNTFGG